MIKLYFVFTVIDLLFFFGSNFIKTEFMRKSSLLLMAFLIIYCSSNSQEIVFKITREYFRSDPFRGEFSSFIKHLFNDPSLTNKLTQKRTDTSLFYFHGTYANYNPFFFKPKRVEVVLTEMEVTLDSLNKDTVYTYQLLAYNDATRQGTEEIKKEFEKIYKHYKNGFAKSVYTEDPPGGNFTGVLYNFFDKQHVISPFAIARYEAADSKEVCLILTIRMDTYDNQAMLPIPFYTSQ